ncbi:hypothetical protein AVEN_88769-1 [Araneus ventricosus]|uniref:Uncharacterized protein n=1 Tax=Araneus ventricosus TaxID=182803 RepID=A0A4Y2Q5M0_ARAVE|nr:hypothetical protein AVEN_88769-1 [Araneus ventricosus]
MLFPSPVGRRPRDRGVCVVRLPLQRPQPEMGDADAVLHLPVLRGARNPHLGPLPAHLPHPAQGAPPLQDGRRAAPGQNTIQGGGHQDAQLVSLPYSMTSSLVPSSRDA